MEYIPVREETWTNYKIIVKGFLMISEDNKYFDLLLVSVPFTISDPIADVKSRRMRCKISYPNRSDYIRVFACNAMDEFGFNHSVGDIYGNGVRSWAESHLSRVPKRVKISKVHKINNKENDNI